MATLCTRSHRFADGTIVQVRVQDCEGAPPCAIVPNTDTLIELDWTPASSFEKGKFMVIVDTSVGPITLANSDFSEETRGESYAEAEARKISNALSAFSVDLTIEVLDSDERVLACVKLAADVQ